MDVQVNKTWCDDAAQQVLGGDIGKTRCQLGVGAQCLHHLSAPGVRPDDQQAVGFERRPGDGRIRKIKNRGAVGFHHAKITRWQQALPRQPLPVRLRQARTRIKRAPAAFMPAFYLFNLP